MQAVIVCIYVKFIYLLSFEHISSAIKTCWKWTKKSQNLTKSLSFSNSTFNIGTISILSLASFIIFRVSNIKVWSRHIFWNYFSEHFWMSLNTYESTEVNRIYMTKQVEQLNFTKWNFKMNVKHKPPPFVMGI